MIIIDYKNTIEEYVGRYLTKMGPRGLSTFLRYQNLTSIQKRDLVFFRGRTIVVDTSIYMYRFKSDG